ncbi:unnamed protein product [Vitrella brassicaformis CCMP3155]|uniref:Protein FAM221A n=1 Tax=Vitrella brassicaformis (strain CCMP3155) TaxID=1169540 RepID=A0A0G4EIB0_VITBC|nr:unnamed protein product [Vitrella brassicaformis CCMP3155]|eukprot:CEL95721.1 unnamed protein product [Vitrella brassicaformis CCMP3155]
MTTRSRSGTGGMPNRGKGKVSLMVYQKLVGESDGGGELPYEQIKDLLGKYKATWGNRLFVHWVNSRGRECVRIKNDCLCLCGHSWKAHEWYDLLHKQAPCRCPGCKCPQFSYLPHQGSWYLHCKCKHLATQHFVNGLPSPCQVRVTLANGQTRPCGCEGLQSTYRCKCGESFHEHTTVIETESERRAAGKPVDADTVAHRLERVHRARPTNGCGVCVGCKCQMPCRKGKAYSKDDFKKISQI